MTPSRAPVSVFPGTHDEPIDDVEGERDTIPAPPPSSAAVGLDASDTLPPESRIESRKLDTIPAPAEMPSFDEEPTTDRAPLQHDAV